MNSIKYKIILLATSSEVNNWSGCASDETYTKIYTKKDFCKKNLFSPQ